MLFLYEIFIMEKLATMFDSHLIYLFYLFLNGKYIINSISAQDE
jgi:hypothetical protein